jgi:hypothetical protein
LKSKLPLGKKAKAESDELEDIESEESNSSPQDERTDLTELPEELEEENSQDGDNSLISKLKNKIQTLNKKAPAGKGQADSDDEDESTNKKKQKSKIIQIVIGLGLVIFLLSDYIIPTEEAKPVQSSFKKPERKKPAQETVATAPAEEKPAEETPPVEASPEGTSEATSETTPEPTTEVATETAPDSPVTVTSEDVQTEGTPEATTESAPVEAAPETTEAPVDEPPVVTEPSPNTDSVDGQITTAPSDENLTDQILLDLEKQSKVDQKAKPKTEYVSPPDYEYRGRALVYNCKGKHWACIDAPSFKICEDNASSVKYLKKSAECHPFNVYETTRGCESMQNRVVSSSAKTNFCGE